MSGELVIFPDTVEALCDYVRTGLDTLGPAIPVGTRVPKPRPDLFVRIERVGGARRNLAIDEPTVVFEAWGTDEGAAHDLAQQVRALVFGSVRQQTSAGMIYRVAESAGPASLPDPDTDQARFTFTMSVAVRGAVS